jgi:Cu(I)/Ag(I) efflux system membrane fusion protein
LKLKPEMFASGLIKSTVLKGENSIIVPKSAVMWTGKRSVVYVKSNSDVGLSFMMREVTLGPSLGDSYIIEEGLEEGEEIATHGTFSIDAAAQLAGKPSMMSPEGGVVMTGHNHGAGSSMEMDHSDHTEDIKSRTTSKDAKMSLSALIDSYLSLKEALVKDDFDESVNQAKKLKVVLKGIPMTLFEGAAHQFWMQEGMPLRGLVDDITNADDIAEARKPFKPLSMHMISLAKAFEPFEEALFIQHCPMADDFKGADWLSTEENILNPYYGESMLTCGEVIEQIK